EWQSVFWPDFHPGDYDTQLYLALFDAFFEATQAREARKLAAVEVDGAQPAESTAAGGGGRAGAAAPDCGAPAAASTRTE
ncbi:hypothetical protein AAHH80_37820, partial [Burkholderia pseudomallei]